MQEVYRLSDQKDLRETPRSHRHPELGRPHAHALQPGHKPQGSTDSEPAGTLGIVPGESQDPKKTINRHIQIHIDAVNTHTLHLKNANPTRPRGGFTADRPGPREGRRALVPEPQEPTFRHWSIAMKDGSWTCAACICHATAGPSSRPDPGRHEELQVRRREDGQSDASGKVYTNRTAGSQQP